jgi:hypothetical protein
MTPRPLYVSLAVLLTAIENCRKTGNAEWEAKHDERLALLVRDHMPSGSGWDCGTVLDVAQSNGAKLVFRGAFHHMDENGMYDGWSDHTITVRPAFHQGFDLHISGRDRNQIKDYLHDLFSSALAQEVTYE